MSSSSLFRALLWCYPGAFREEYGGEMERAFREQWSYERRARGSIGLIALWMRTIFDTMVIAPQEHLHMISQDLRYALRMLRAQPGFALVAVLSLALGIGANTAIFGLLNEALLRSLPVPQPERLVILTDPTAAGVFIGAQTGGPRNLMTYQEFLQLREQNSVFESMFASQSQLNRWQIRVEGGAQEEARGRLVSGDFFSVLGGKTILGRTFTKTEDAGVGAAPYCVLSYDYWQRRFGGDASVLGKTLTIQRTPFTIIGVAADGFFGETLGQKPDLWAPMTMQMQVIPGRDWLHDRKDSMEKAMWVHVFGRLKPGVTIAQAQINASLIFQRTIESSYGSSLAPDVRRRILDQRILVQQAGQGASDLRERFAQPLFVLLAVVGAVLLIACANLANLLLARATARQREIGVRLALGASRARLVRQLLTESLLLAAMGGVAGLGVAVFASRMLVQLASSPRDPLQLGASLDWRVLSFTAVVTILTALLFGLLPAWKATSHHVGATLKEQGRGLTSSTARMHLGKVLVIGQIALSLLLLVGAGMFLRTLRNLEAVDLGYNREQLLLARVDALSGGYSGARLAALYRELPERVRAIPGVRAVTISENGLFGGTDSGDRVVVEGYTPKGDNDQGSNYDQVGPGYFTTLGIPILLGRDLNENDREGAPYSCVINEAFAKQFFAGRNPIGLHVTDEFGETRITYQVVGVARNSRDHRLRGETPRRFFVPVFQPAGDLPPSIHLEIRATQTPDAIMGAVRKAVQEINPDLVILNMRSLGELITDRVAQERLIARLSAIFGLLALALASIGLYGVLSYGIAQRTNEIGIRMALGAKPATVVNMVLSETGRMVLCGLLGGLVLAAGCMRLVATMLFGLAPGDPITFLGAAILLTLVAVIAGYLPAARASRVDPLVALRHE